MKKWLTALAFLVVLVVGVLGGAKWFPSQPKLIEAPKQEIFREILKEENAVIDVVDSVSPSVVTVGVKKTEKVIDPSAFFDPFNFFNQRPQVQEQKIEQDIGSGFIIDESGLVVTNKHVVADLEAE